MFFFLSHSVFGSNIKQIQRHEIDTEFIKILDDRTMRDTIKKTKNSFVLFHADHQRLSDTAYLNYISVANEFKGKADFFVVPASVGADVGRTYAIPGNPSLLHFNFGTKNGLHLGMFSHDSIRRFVANYTKQALIELEIADTATESDIFKSISDATIDRPHAVVLFCDDSTQFGRAAYKLINDLGVYFTFVNIKNPQAARNFNVRSPSIVFIRYEDSMRFVYTSEADPDEMFIWVQHCSIPNFKEIKTLDLFSPDGVSMKSIVTIIDKNDYDMSDKAYQALGKLSNEQNWVRLYYSDINSDRAFANLLKVEKLPTTIYLSANYTHIKYYSVNDVCNKEVFDSFFNDSLKLNVVETPQEMYDDMRPINEYAFERMLEEGPSFTLFNSKFCVKCFKMKQSVFDAAHVIRRNGGKVRWGSWDVTLATPSFQKEMDIGVPSLWYFPDANMTHGEQYAGPQNYLSIIEWVNAKLSFNNNMENVMENEVDAAFDQI